jgi:hypothetical protein
MGNSNITNEKDKVDQTKKDKVLTSTTSTNTSTELQVLPQLRILLTCHYFGQDDYRFAFPTCSGKHSYVAGVKDSDTIDIVATKLHACHPSIMPDPSEWIYDLIVSPSTPGAGDAFSMVRCIQPNERKQCLSSFECLSSSVSTFDRIEPSEELGSKIVFIQSIFRSRLMCQITTTSRWDVLINRLKQLTQDTNISVQFAGRSNNSEGRKNVFDTLSHLHMSMLSNEATIYLAGKPGKDNVIFHPLQNLFTCTRYTYLKST